MVEKNQFQKFHEYVHMHKKKIFVYNIIVAAVLFLILLQYESMTNNQVDQTEMKEQVEHRCFNEVELPPSGKYAVKFTKNEFLNITLCEVIIYEESK